MAAFLCKYTPSWRFSNESVENPTQNHAVIATPKILIMQSFHTGGGTCKKEYPFNVAFPTDVV